MPYSRRDLSLQRMRRLLALIDNPHHRLRVVHVAGTNGKGSTTAFLRSALSAAGFRCGAYTSPHLHHVEERFVVDQSTCSPEQFVELVDGVRPAVQQLDEEMEGRGPTYFEITTAIACEYFLRARADVAVLEVGLGGRLDSTNVCLPLVSVITSISYDHTRQLGNTLQSIAREKAGIIKQGVTVVSGAATSDAQAAIGAVCEAKSSPLRQLGVDFRFAYQAPEGVLENRTGLLDFEVCQQGIWQPQFRSVPLGLLGKHQAANAAVALATLRELPPDLVPGERAIRRGFLAARCPARIDILDRTPLTIVDAAHNVAAIQALIATLNECLPNRRRSLLLAMTRGKDLEGMLRLLLPEFDRVICTRYLKNPRGVDPTKLAELAGRICSELELGAEKQIVCCPDPAAAWNRISADASPTDLVCVTGSFFIAAEIEEILSANVPAESEPD